MRDKTVLRHLGSITLVWVLMMVFALTVTPITGQRYPPYTPFVAWNPNEQFLAVGHGTNLSILDASTLTVVNSLNNLEVQDVSAAWNPDGSRLAVVNGYDLEIWQQPWSPVDAQQAFNYRHYDRYNPPTPASPITHVAWSPDGTEIAVAHGEVIDVADTTTGTFLREIIGEWGYITDFDWFADDRFALSAVYGRFGYVVDASTGSILNYFYTGGFTQMSSYVNSVAFSPDRNSLVVGTNDSIIALWSNTQDAEYINDTPNLLFGNLNDQRHQLGVDALDWSPTGQHIASGSQDGTVRLWDAITGEQLQVINLGEDAWVYSVAWSPDGSKLAYGNSDGSVAFFDATQLPGYEPMATAEAPSND